MSSVACWCGNSKAKPECDRTCDTLGTPGQTPSAAEGRDPTLDTLDALASDEVGDIIQRRLAEKQAAAHTAARAVIFLPFACPRCGTQNDARRAGICRYCGWTKEAN